MVHFYIVWHGQTLLNSSDRAQGWADSPLTGAVKRIGEGKNVSVSWLIFENGIFSLEPDIQL